MVKVDFSVLVKQAREAAELSQEDMARVLNVSFVTLNRWENAKAKPSKLAKAAFQAFCANNGLVIDEEKGVVRENGDK